MGMVPLALWLYQHLRPLRPGPFENLGWLIPRDGRMNFEQKKATFTAPGFSFLE